MIHAMCVLLVVCGILLPEAIGLIRPDYNSSGHYLSELGAQGVEYAQFINFLGFLPVAIVSLVIAVAIQTRVFPHRLAQIGLRLLGGGIFVGYLGAFFFPCDYGCPAEGSSRQAIHNAAGAAEYVFAVIGLLLLALGLKNRTLLATRILVFATAIIVILGFLMMLEPTQSDVRGLWQRSADYSMFALLVFLSVKTTVPRTSGH